MQQYSTHRSSTPWLIAAAGVGALLAYALASPRRRSALAAAGQTALGAGQRLVSTSAERLREWIPERDAINRFSDDAQRAADSATASATGRLHDVADRARDLTHQVVARARRLPSSVREQWHDVREQADDAVNGGNSGRAVAGGLIVAAAAVGAGLYALQRYGGSERLRHKLGADDSGTITLEKTIFIEAPIEQVFDTWADYENFPRFMSHVKRVQPLDGQRSHWTVRGPAGIGVEFDSVAQMQRPTELAWQSEPNAVQNSGRVTLVPEASGTRVTVRLQYRPPVGAMGQAVSSLLGANPKEAFEHDLDCMKEFIESRRRDTPQPSSSMRTSH